MAIVAIIDTGYKTYDYEKKLFPGMGHDLQIFQGERLDIAGKKLKPEIARIREEKSATATCS